ncbi:carbohydrate ABC transporter permease [Globicatella sp. PHS-GS-PNBC-21-1553]|uniref:carbohydrate ABC transporter permease n=1 Tax=Globicatella sp. PHS-GS-PNBC-21-1553 TaxID=2885764 RepID=UPI00298F1B5F|nr:carbohydrate ABC transporter permease [Globicatella sp. PHS-GS-PNBC-21-1553]
MERVQVDRFGKKTNFIFSILMSIVGFLGVFPFIFIIIVSLTSENSIIQNGYKLFPSEWSIEGYRYLSTMSGQILNALMVSVLVTVLGTIINVTFTSTYAYALSRPNLPFKKFFLVLIIIPMLIGAGLVPGYIVVTNLLNLKNTIWALILPAAFSPFNIIIMRTFFKKSVPNSIIESARIDGASELRVFLQIVLPLSVPGLATIGLFAAIGYWNDWFNALLYITKTNLYPLQYVLMNIQSNIDYMLDNAGLGINISQLNIPKEATRMALVVIATLPIAVSYPFFQKYFISGLTIGGVKE